MIGKKILLAEDDPFILDIYSNALKAAGYRVEIARDGAAALEKAKTLYPDLLILDIGLPKMDGWQVLRALRSNPANQGVKVIILSNLNPNQYPPDALGLGVSKFFIKIEHTIDDIINAVGEIA